MKIRSLITKILPYTDSNTKNSGFKNNMPKWACNLSVWLVIVVIAILINIRINGIAKYTNKEPSGAYAVELPDLTKTERK